MAKVTLTMRDRFGLYCHISPQPIKDRKEGRQSDKLWEGVELVSKQATPWGGARYGSAVPPFRNGHAQGKLRANRGA